MSNAANNLVRREFVLLVSIWMGLDEGSMLYALHGDGSLFRSIVYIRSTQRCPIILARLSRKNRPCAKTHQ